VAKILVAEDDASQLKKLERVLKSAGHDCVAAPSGKEVIDLCRSEQPAMLILDVMLPGTSGFEVCRQIRRDESLFRLPILILSAMGEDEEVEHGLAQGADDYATKPYQEQNLLQRIDMLLRINTDSNATDGLTALPGSEAAKREIQRRLSSGTMFSVACVELLNLRDLARRQGKEARDKAIRHLARALQRCGEQVSQEHFYVAHMGGGYFVCLCEPNEAERYAAMVNKLWGKHSETLKERLQATPSPEGIQKPELLMCVTGAGTDLAMSTQQLFDTLAQLRHKALQERQAGLHFDRRAH
jgi:DNA-binding response OmpR family regulator